MMMPWKRDGYLLQGNKNLGSIIQTTIPFNQTGTDFLLYTGLCFHQQQLNKIGTSPALDTEVGIRTSERVKTHL